MRSGWQSKTLPELCDFQRGLTYSKDDEVAISNTVVLRATNIDLRSNSLDLSDLRYINDSVVVPSNKVVKRDSLLICTASGSKSHLGKIAYIDDHYEYAYGGFMGMLTPKDNIVPKYLFYLMTSGSYQDFIGALSDGTNINNLKFDDLKSFSVPLPPLPEQRRIVTLLDEAFDGIAAAKANAETNLRNAWSIFDSCLSNLFTERGIDWTNTTIGQCIRFIDYRGKTPEKSNDGLRLITAKNVKMGYLQDQPMEFVPVESYNNWMTRGIPKLGDVLFTTEAPLANVAQLDTDDKVVFGQRIIIMQPDSSKLHSDFLKYLLLSKPVQQRIHSFGTGATVQGIKASLLKCINISYPSSLMEQERIVSNLDALKNETDRIEAIYRQKLAALSALKTSLLHHAFAGEL